MLLALAVATAATTDSNPAAGSLAERLTGAAAVLAFTVAGAFVVGRRPRHPVGWLLVGFGLAEGLVQLSLAWSRHAFLEPDGGWPAGEWAGWVYSWAWALPSFLPVFVLLTFPDGLLPGRAWRRVARLGAGALAVLVVGSSLYPTLFEDQDGWPAGVDNPLGLQGATAALDLVTSAALLALAVTAIASLVSIVLRFRRAGDEDRSRLRLALLAGAVVALTAVVPVPPLAFVAALAAFAVVLVVTILRHGLYGVQAVVSRSLVYLALAGLTTAVYLGLVALVGAVAGGSRGGLPVAIAATALAAVAFQPLRSRVERRVRRFVFGARAEPQRLLADAGARLAATVDLDDIPWEVGRLLVDGLGAAAAEVESSSADQAVIAGDRAVTSGTPVAELPVRHAGRPVATIRVWVPADRWGEAERSLAAELAARAGPALANVALAAELRASRRRLVEAQDTERRRIERDLHDGAQQHLAAVAAQLGLARQLVPDDAAIAAALDRSVTLLDHATDSLRSLARGIYPSVLADRGVAAALRADADGAPWPFRVEYATDGGRAESAVEAAVYFACKEALQNVARHADASEVRVTVEADDGDLRFEIADDGRGFPPDRARGQGLTNIADRIGALGGEVRISSTPGAGTVVAGRVPAGRPGTAAPRAPGDGPPVPVPAPVS